MLPQNKGAKILTFLVVAYILASGVLLYFLINSQALSGISLEPKVMSVEDNAVENVVDTYTVTRVIDGDTIEIFYDGVTEKVRLIGIDTPELRGKGGRECFAVEAKDYLRKLLLRRPIRIEGDTTQAVRDKYNRLLLYIWLIEEDAGKEKELFVNKEMLAEGYAHEYTYDSPYKFQEEFKAAEKNAERSNKGLWGDACK